MCFYKLSRFAWFVSMASWELRISEVPEEMYSAILRGEGALIATMALGRKGEGWEG